MRKGACLTVLSYQNVENICLFNFMPVTCLCFRFTCSRMLLGLAENFKELDVMNHVIRTGWESVKYTVNCYIITQCITEFPANIPQKPFEIFIIEFPAST